MPPRSKNANLCLLLMLPSGERNRAERMPARRRKLGVAKFRFSQESPKSRFDRYSPRAWLMMTTT